MDLEVVRLLSLINHPSTSNQVRLESHHQLSLLPPNTVSLGLTLFTHNDVSVRFYGLSLLQSCSTQFNGSLDCDLNVDQISNLLLSLTASDPLFLHLKACSIFVWFMTYKLGVMTVQPSLASQRMSLWSQMNAFLVNLYVSNALLALTTLDLLSQYTHQDCTSTDLKEFLKSALFGISADTEIVRKVCLQEGSKNLKNLLELEQSNEGWIRRLLSSLPNSPSKAPILNSLNEMMEWIALYVIHDLNILAIMLEYMAVEGAATVVLTIVSRAIKVEDTDFRGYFLMSPFFDSYLEKLDGMIRVCDNEGIRKTMVEIIMTVGSNHLCQKRNVTFAPTARYLEIVSGYMNLPIKSLAITALHFISDALKHEYLKVVMQRYCTVILGLVLISVEPEDEDDDEQEKRSMVETTKRLEILKLLTVLEGNASFLFIAEKVSHYFIRPVPYSLDLLVKAVEVIIPIASLGEDIEPLLKLVMQMEPRTLKEINAKLSILGAFITLLEQPKYHHWTAQLFNFFLSTSGQTLDVEKALKSEVYNMRKKSWTFICSLVQSTPERFRDHKSQIEHVILSKMAIMNSTEQRLAIEVFVILCLTSQEPIDMKQVEMQRVLNHEISVLKEYDPILESNVGFGAGLIIDNRLLSVFEGVQPMTLEANKAMEIVTEKRRRLLDSVLSFRHWIKRSYEVTLDKNVGVAFGETLGMILRVTLKYIKLIDSIWTQNCLPRLLVKIKDLTRFEKDMLLGREFESKEKLSDLDSQIFKIWSWTGRSREACYQLINSLSPMAYLYDTETLLELILATVFGSAKDLELHHWKALLGTVLTPIVTKCPQKYLYRLDQFINSMTLFLNQKLVELWNSNESTNEENGDLGEEVVKQKMSRLFTRSYADFWSSVTSIDQLSVYKNGPLLLHIFSNQVLRDQICASLLLLMALPDTVSCLNGIVVFQRVLPLLLTHNSAFVASELVSSLLQVYHEGYHKANHVFVVTLLVDIYLKANREILFTTYLAAGLSEAKLKEYDSEMAEAVGKKKSAVTAHFLNAIGQGKEVSQLGKVSKEVKSVRKIHIQRDVGRASILNDSAQESVLSLFE